MSKPLTEAEVEDRLERVESAFGDLSEITDWFVEVAEGWLRHRQAAQTAADVLSQVAQDDDLRDGCSHSVSAKAALAQLAAVGVVPKES